MNPLETAWQPCVATKIARAVNATPMSRHRSAPYVMFPMALDDAPHAAQRAHPYPLGFMFESSGMVTRHAVEEP